MSGWGEFHEPGPTLEELRRSHHQSYLLTRQVLYWSEDNGQLYEPKTLDPNEPKGLRDVPGYVRYWVPAHIELTPAQLCVTDGSLIEALLQSDQAVAVQPDDTTPDDILKQLYQRRHR